MNQVSREYWGTLTHPLAPSLDDVAIYKQHIKSGSTLLLGCTKSLVELSTEQMDIDPWCITPGMIVADWTKNTRRYTNIIGDGVLNFTKALCDNLLEMCHKHSDVFIARCFNKKLESMKVAAYFPKREEFNVAPTSVVPFDEYSFFVWQFK